MKKSKFISLAGKYNVTESDPAETIRDLIYRKALLISPF